MKKTLFLILLIPITLIAQDKKMIKYGVDTNSYIPTGIKIGEKAPKIVSVSLNGDTINSNEILKEKNIVLIFYRGKWCPLFAIDI